MIEKICNSVKCYGSLTTSGSSLDHHDPILGITDDRILLLLNRAYNIFQLDFSLTSKLRAKNLIIDLYITLELVDHLTASDLVLPLGDHFPGKGSGRCLISRRSFIIIIKQTTDRSSPVIYQRTMSGCLGQVSNSYIKDFRLIISIIHKIYPPKER